MKKSTDPQIEKLVRKNVEAADRVKQEKEFKAHIAKMKDLYARFKVKFPTCSFRNDWHCDLIKGTCKDVNCPPLRTPQFGPFD